MEFAEVPAFFCPSTVLMVDDNHRFLRHISLQLAAPLHSKLFNDAEEALVYLSSVTNSVAASKAYPYMVADIESSTCVGNRYSMNCDLSAIHKMAYNNDRFKMVSVAVIDYAMPKINGLAFCRRLKDTPIKKIMLTGEADHQIAVEAFNEGLIDQFILKSTPNLNQQLNDGMVAMQQKYFLNLTQNITHSLLSESTYCLKDPKVAGIFRALCKQHDIVEYYLLDTSGTVLLLDMFGHPSWFVVRNSLELKMYAALAEDEGVSEILCEQLKNGQKVPFFPRMIIETSKWNSYLHSASIIEGQQTYYYTFLKDVDITETSFDMKDIVSYRDYLKQNSRELQMAVS